MRGLVTLGGNTDAPPPLPIVPPEPLVPPLVFEPPEPEVPPELGVPPEPDVPPLVPPELNVPPLVFEPPELGVPPAPGAPLARIPPEVAAGTPPLVVPLLAVPPTGEVPPAAAPPEPATSALPPLPDVEGGAGDEHELDAPPRVMATSASSIRTHRVISCGPPDEGVDQHQRIAGKVLGRWSQYPLLIKIGSLTTAAS